MIKKQLRKRKDCFLGFHTDFHANPSDGMVIGATLREADIRELCESVKPDYIQIDCKGHPGWASYPSDLGNAMPQFACDTLKVWRKVTYEYDIPLYMHYSGLYDMKYCKDNPEEAIMKADGTRSGDFVRLDSRYVDELFIPQVCELWEKYHIDGIWVDGDCWAVSLDFSPETVEKFEKKTGISLGGNYPTKKGDKYYREYMEFTRERFREYLRYYVDTLHKKCPGLEVCSNWAYSAFMPEPKTIDIDFISGDLVPINGINNARFAGRMISLHNFPWDIMSWGHRSLVYHNYQIPGKPEKHPVQLMQEAAFIISLGGGYQSVCIQGRDGSPDMNRIRSYKPVADFVRERKAYCFRGEQVPQVAVLVSTYDKYESMRFPFTGQGNEEYYGIIALLNAAGHSVGVINDSMVENECEKYPLIVVPEISSGLPDSVIEALRKYVLSGGSLLLAGSNTAHIFAENGFGFKAEINAETFINPGWNGNNGHEVKSGEGERHPAYFSLDGESFAVTYNACTVKAENADAQTLAYLFGNVEGEGRPFAKLFDFGKGKIGVIGTNIGFQYIDGMQYQHKQLIKEITGRMYQPFAKIESSYGAELVILRKDGKVMLQLVNANGNHSNVTCVTEDYIPPAVDVKITLRTDEKPKKLILHPAEKELSFEYKNGVSTFTVDRVDIHEIVEVIM